MRSLAPSLRIFNSLVNSPVRQPPVPRPQPLPLPLRTLPSPCGDADFSAQPLPMGSLSAPSVPRWVPLPLTPPPAPPNLSRGTLLTRPGLCSPVGGHWGCPHPKHRHLSFWAFGPIVHSGRRGSGKQEERSRSRLPAVPVSNTSDTTSLLQPTEVRMVTPQVQISLII